MQHNSPATLLPRCTSLLLLLLVAAFLWQPQCAHAYNIDLPSYVRHTLSPNTMFGFSIAFHKALNEYQQLSTSLIVGAPKFNTSSYQERVVEAGAVFKCGMTDGDCSLVKFDSQGNNKNTDGDFIDRKSYQWLGATVATSRDNDLIVACAPRYVFHTMRPRASLRYDPVGTCFTSRNFKQFKEVSPCRTNNWGYHRQGSCQAGFSAAAAKSGDRLYIGAPGSWYWQGQAYSVSPDATFPYKPPFYQHFGTGGQAYSYDVTLPENQVFSTAESSSQYDDSYLGYSMTSGDFNGDSVEDVAIGMPRGAGLLGKVVVNAWNMANIVNITGRQIGEYFGYALTTSDVDGDGLDDLIIGAPMYSESGNVEGKYDVGRVFIFLQANKNNANQWETEIIRDGYNTKGRFGLALTSLGDINQDGFGDFAVGAPYDGQEGRGIVYVFHGSANGPLRKPSQIIKAEDIVEGAPYPRTFGFALAGGIDMDGNTYPDLAVGAYDSNQVFIFKSRPVAAVSAMVTFLDSSKLINLDEKQCETRRDGKRVACTTFTTCWSYVGKYLPGNLEFDMSWVLDAKKPKSPRMFFLADEGRNIRNQSVSLYYGKTYCRNETVYLVDSIQDKLTPLEVETRYSLRGGRPQVPIVIRRKREALEPIIDQNREIVQRDAINIQKNCGPDNICIPDLQLMVKTANKYLLGSPNPLVLEVFVTNRNEDAFEAAFYMVIPKDLDYIKTEIVGDKKDSTTTCGVPNEENNYTLKCTIGNPLQSNKMVHFKVILTPSKRVGMAPSYDFFMEANSTNVENKETLIDNIITERVSIWVQTDMVIQGKSLPDFQLYKASDYKAVVNATKEEDLGPQVVHLYNILNNGPSTVEEAVVLIHYPYETAAGDLLMYMTNQPETAGSIQCDPHIMVNPRGLKLDAALSHKSYLESSGAVVRSSASASAATHIQRPASGVTTTGSKIEVVTVGQSGKVLTDAEKKRLEKEDQQDVSGDASFVHLQRANAASADSSISGGPPSRTVTWTTTVRNGTHEHPPQTQQVTYYSQSGNYPNTNAANTNGGYSTTTHQQMVGGGPTRTFHVQQSQPRYNELAGGTQGNLEKQHSSSNFGEAAATGGGGGFHAGTLDLGTLRRDNVDNELRHHSEGGSAPYGYQQTHTSSSSSGSVPQGYQQTYTSSSGSVPQGYQQTYSSSSGGGTVPQGFQQTYSSSSGGSVPHGYQQTYSSSSGSGSVPHGYQQTYSSSSGSSPQGYQQSFSSSTPNRNARGGGTNSNQLQAASVGGAGEKPYYGMEHEYYYDDENAQQQQPRRRVRRQEPAIPQQEAPAPLDINSPCKTAKCQTLRCVAKNLGKDDGVWVAIRTRMVAKTMEKLSSSVPLNISTMAVSYVTKLPYIGAPKDEIIKSHEIFYKAVPEPTPVPDVVPLWVVVLSACAGALILLLLIYLLYKCGFFKRHRPTDHSTERQPLRNGYHGDEHL